MKEGLVITGICLALILFYGLLTYVKFVSLRKRVRCQMEQIDLQLRKRYDMAYRLTDDAKRYVPDERDAIENVVRARLIAMGRNDISEKARDNEKLQESIIEMVSLLEKASDNGAESTISERNSQIEQINDQIQSAEAYYNDTVYKYNKSIESFPGNIVARIGRFYKARPFVCDGEEADNLGYAMRIL